MAQSLDARITSALKAGSRLSDCEALLIDTEAELARVSAHREDAVQRRADPSLSEDEAAEAQLQVQEDDLRLIRLHKAIERLREIIVAKKETATAAKALEHYNQVEARRDKLAEELREYVAPALRLIAEYCQRVVSSDAEIAEVNRKLPKDCRALLSAEQVARGYAGHTWGKGHSLVLRLVDLRLPHFDRQGSAWPDVEGDARRRAESAVRSQKAVAKAQADREASKMRCFVSRPAGLQGMIVLTHADGRTPVHAAPIDCWLYPELITLAEKQGLTIEPWSEARAKSVEAELRARADA